MIRTISRTVNGRYPNIIKNSRVYFGGERSEKLYNFNRLKYFPKGPSSFEGYECCGIFTYLLTPYVKHDLPALNLKTGYSYIGYGRHLEDHVFLTTVYHNKEIIIDPTYRQFLVNPRCDGSSEYSKKLFEKLPPFYVGTKENLENIVKELETLDKEIFGSIGSINKDEIMYWWENNGKDMIPFDNDAYECILDKNHFEKKTPIFKKVIKEVKNDLEIN